jgi:hypothetical protein
LELQPPSDAEVDRYLGYLEGIGMPIEDVRATLTTDQELRQLLRSPLLLHVVALAYHGRPPAALYGPGTLQQRKAWLWEAYVARMFEQRPLGPGDRYTREQALGWLAWLARILQDRDQTEFHLDRLAPEWLPTPTQQRRTRLAIALASGLIGGLGFGLTFVLVAKAFGLAFGLLGGLAVGLGCGLAFGLVAGLVFGLSGTLTVGVESTEPIQLSWSTLRARLARGMTLRLRDGQAVPNEDRRRWAHNAPFAATFGLAGGLIATVIGGLIGGLPYALAAGLAGGLTIGLASGLVSGLAGELIIGVESTEHVRWSWSKLRAGLTRGLAGGLIGGLGAGLAAMPLG